MTSKKLHIIYFIMSWPRQVHYINLLSKLIYLKNLTFNISNIAFEISKRYRYKDVKNIEMVFKDTEEFETDGIEETTDKVFYIIVNSLRTDLILKTGLGIARKKIELAFYANKIRKNGQKVFKKSEIVQIGDEIDLIVNKTPSNSNFLLVSRIKITALKYENNSYKIKILRDKNLLIENEILKSKYFN